MKYQGKINSVLGGLHLKKKHTTISILLLWVLVVTVTLVVLYAVRAISETGGPGSSEVEPSGTVPKTPGNTAMTQPADDVTSTSKASGAVALDLQPVVDEWLGGVYGNAGVMIYDLDNERVVAEHEADTLFMTASVYKLFVVYEGYRRVQSGEWSGDDPAGATGYTILECLDLAIRESNSQCAEVMLAEIGRDKMEEIIEEDFKITDSMATRLSATPRDVAKMLEIYYHHDEITSQQLVAQMQDSFLNQPATEYDWRQGLPAGFTTAKAYNKVGWEYDDETGQWNIYNDAAIVEIPMGYGASARHLVIVVMTNGVGFQKIRALGEMIEEVVTN